MCLLETLLCFLGRVFWVIVMLKNPSTTHFQCPDPAVHGPVHRPFDAVQFSCPFSRKTPQSIMFWLGWCSWGHRVELMSKSWILVSSDHSTFTQFSSESLALQTGFTCAFLSRGACWHCRISVLHGVVCFLEPGSLWALQDFSPSRRSVLS